MMLNRTDVAVRGSHASLPQVNFGCDSEVDGGGFSCLIGHRATSCTAPPNFGYQFGYPIAGPQFGGTLSGEPPLLDMVCEGLVRLHPGSTDLKNIEPALAERWAASQDRKSWKFFLRKGFSSTRDSVNSLPMMRGLAIATHTFEYHRCHLT
jgi:hypothetical protein